MKKLLPLMFLLSSCSCSLQVWELQYESTLQMAEKEVTAPDNYQPKTEGLNGPDRSLYRTAVI